jgi:D-alanine-D-alanine ligase
VTVAVLFGGPAPEHDISILTGLQALRELERNGRGPLGIYWTKVGDFVTVDATTEAEAFLGGVPRGGRALELRLGPDGGFFESAGRLGRDRRVELDAVLLATHGGPGEDGSLQAALDLAGVRYSGPTVAGAALGMDKWSFGAALAAHHLPTLPRTLLEADTSALPFPGPYILKPRFGGSSIGIDVVADLATAVARRRANEHLTQGCVVEPYRRDLFDLQVAVRTFPDVAFSAIEKPIRRSTDTEILDYRDKYVGGEGMVSAPRELPAQLASERVTEILRVAAAVVDIAGVRGVARIDFLANDTELYVNEINTIPGSLSKHLFVDPPLPFLALLDDLVGEARARPTHAYSSAGADGLVLRSAGSIAAKLA